MKQKLLLISFLIVGSVQSQGLTIGLGSGTSLIRLEAGYSLTEKNHIVATIGPGFTGVYASEYGVAFRRTFEESDLGFGYGRAGLRGYVGAGVGIIKTPVKTTGTLNFQNLTYDEEQTGGETLLGFNAHAGAEFLFGSRSKYASFLEIQAGRVPSFLNFISEKQTAALGFVGGIRFYFSN
jgi:hypothetical protein